jgi:hypothetical protein
MAVKLHHRHSIIQYILVSCVSTRAGSNDAPQRVIITAYSLSSPFSHFFLFWRWWWLLTILLVEISISNQNRNFVLFRWKMLRHLLKSCTEIGIPMSESGFRNRNTNRNSDVEIKIESPIPTSKFEINMEFLRNFHFVESKQSKSKHKFKFRLQYRNRNFGKSKHRNFDETRIKFILNFDFVENK